jgi:hypothetical protein
MLAFEKVCEVQAERPLALGDLCRWSRACVPQSALSFVMAILSRTAFLARHGSLQTMPPSHGHVGCLSQAAEYFRIKLHVVPVGPNYRLSAATVRRYMNGNTAILVASAPGFPHGLVDDVEVWPAVPPAVKSQTRVWCGTAYSHTRLQAYTHASLLFEIAPRVRRAMPSLGWEL